MCEKDTSVQWKNSANPILQLNLTLDWRKYMYFPFFCCLHSSIIEGVKYLRQTSKSLTLDVNLLSNKLSSLYVDDFLHSGIFHQYPNHTYLAFKILDSKIWHNPLGLHVLLNTTNISIICQNTSQKLLRCCLPLNSAMYC